MPKHVRCLNWVKSIVDDSAPKPDLLQLHSLFPNTAPSFTADRITWVDINILQFYTTYFSKPDNAASLLSSIIHRFIPPPLFRFQRKLCKILKKCNNRRKCTVYTSKNQHFYKLGSFISGFSSKEAHIKKNHILNLLASFCQVHFFLLLENLQVNVLETQTSINCRAKVLF